MLQPSPCLAQPLCTKPNVVREDSKTWAQGWFRGVLCSVEGRPWGGMCVCVCVCVEKTVATWQDAVISESVEIV